MRVCLLSVARPAPRFANPHHPLKLPVLTMALDEIDHLLGLLDLPDDVLAVSNNGIATQSCTCRVDGKATGNALEREVFVDLAHSGRSLGC